MESFRLALGVSSAPRGVLSRDLSLLVVIELPENAFSTPHHNHISICHSENLTVEVMLNGLKEIKVMHSTRSQREKYSVIMRPPAGQSERYKAAHWVNSTSC